MVVPVPPQVHLPIVTPTDVLVNAAPEEVVGINVKTPPVVAVAALLLLMLRLVTVTVAPASVATVATYCEGFAVEPKDSQPQPFAAGNWLEADCTVSVIDVRQPEAAKMISEFLARTV